MELWHLGAVPADEKFSVIIPTLQRSPQLWPLVEQCAAHGLVGEVLVINNSSEPLQWESQKVRVLQQARNIYVNPAWNLGVREARHGFLAIINDDVRFGDEALVEAHRVLARGWFGVVSPDRSCFLDVEPQRSISHRLAGGNNIYRGTFMALRRTDYVPIPEQMRIWGGDDWLMGVQKRPNAVLVATRFQTLPGTTTLSPEFQAMREQEQAICDLTLSQLKPQWWSRPVGWIDRLRALRHRVSAR